jgi:deoxyribodipyrimidine photolyase-like uncharacterized protein
MGTWAFILMRLRWVAKYPWYVPMGVYRSFYYYVSSGSYINKMSNYCKAVPTKSQRKRKKMHAHSTPYTNFFLDEKKEYLQDNQRMNMIDDY